MDLFVLDLLVRFMKDKQVCMSWNGKLLCFMERVRVMNNKNGVS